MIRKLYGHMAQEMDGADTRSVKMKEEILALLKEEEECLERQEYERCRDKAFQAASIGEESGFERGFKYAFQLFMECSHL